MIKVCVSKQLLYAQCFAVFSDICPPPLYGPPPSLPLGTCVISRYATAQSHLYFTYLSTPIRHDDHFPYFDREFFQTHTISSRRRIFGHRCINNCTYLYASQSGALVMISFLAYHKPHGSSINNGLSKAISIKNNVGTLPSDPSH